MSVIHKNFLVALHTQTLKDSYFIKQADGNDEFYNRGFKIKGQRLKFDNYFVSVCETTIEQILFIAI